MVVLDKNLRNLFKNHHGHKEGIGTKELADRNQGNS